NGLPSSSAGSGDRRARAPMAAPRYSVGTIMRLEYGCFQHVASRASHLTRRLRWIAALSCLVAAVPAGTAAAQAAASGKSFLWKVQNGAAVLYLAGSV